MITSVAFDQCTHCWQQLMHNTFITQAPYLGEDRHSGFIVSWFNLWTSGSLGGVILRFILNLALMTVFCVNCKLKQNTYMFPADYIVGM